MPENTSEEKEMTLEEKVIQYFVDLFKHQKGLRRRAGSEIEFLESSRFNPKIKTYKVNVNARDSWKSRRVTVGPIGENTGSKSTCFYAIYDNKLVLKVSPSPVTDFETYIQNIQKERQIVNKLAPRECIIPEVSVVLKKIRASVADESANEQEREAACAQWLRENPEYQEFFKIDGGFIYVMDLSRYVFLSDAVSLFHGVENNIAEEIIRDPSVIDDFDKFEGRYGLENAQIGMDLKSVYTEFEDQLRTLMIRSGASSSMLLYKTQEWFTTYVAGRKIKKDNKELTEDFVKQLNALLNKTVTENQAVIDEYRRMIGDYLHHSSFARHRAHMEGIVSNTLELLAWLRKKGVAIRDIKPDNLLVAGDPERYPNFLSTPASYQIGLIDVETAVDFAPADGKLMQPQLGGTPFYATPLHMFDNKTLAGVYKDLPRVFHLQDWFSTLAMIYGIVMNEYLFGKTAKELVLLTKFIQKGFRGKKPASEIVKEANQKFWQSAMAEFNENIKKNEDRLRALTPTLFESVQQMFVDELEKDTHMMNRSIKKLIASQSIFKNTNNKEQLYRSSPQKMSQVIHQLKKKNQGDVASLGKLEKIRQLKSSAQTNRENIEWIKAESSGISVYNLLEIMFYTVRNYFYKRDG